MIFGPILPILFPIGLLSLIILYVLERLLLAYSYRRPPMFDVTINRTTIELLTYAPIIYLLSGAWNYSNQQLFMNKVVPKTDTSYYPPTDHFAHQQFTQLTPGTPFAIMLCVLALGTLYYKLRYCITRRKSDIEELED